MDDRLRDFIYRKWDILGASFSFLDALLAVCITATGLLLRSTVINAYTDTGVEKLLGFILEYMLAVLCAAIAYQYTRRGKAALLTYAVLVIYPTVIANGALMDCGSVYYVILFFLGLYLWNRSLRAWAAASMLAGTAAALYRVYVWAESLGGETPESLTRGWPNIYEIIGGEAFVELYAYVSVLFLAGLLITAAYCFFRKNVRISPDMALLLLLFISILIPYVAPFMPAWAGYTADIAALLYCVRYKERFWVPMLQLIVSYSAYAYATNGETKLPMVVFAVILLAELTAVGADVYREACAQTEK